MMYEGKLRKNNSKECIVPMYIQMNYNISKHKKNLFLIYDDIDYKRTFDILYVHIFSKFGICTTHNIILFIL